MKAIHNTASEGIFGFIVVWDQRYIIIESNSQLVGREFVCSWVVWDQSYIIIESNSQLINTLTLQLNSCVGSKLHNNWKQFTTSEQSTFDHDMLCGIKVT